MKQTLILLLLIISTKLFAETSFDQTLESAKMEGLKRQSTSVQQANQFHGNEVFTAFSKSPDEVKYYDQNNISLHAAIEAKKSDENVKDITNSISNHPKYVISPSNADLKRSQLLQSESYNILHGVTSQYVDCKPKENCISTYLEKKCEESGQQLFPNCHKKLIVTVTNNETVTHFPLTAILTVKDHNYVGVNINTVNGRVDFIGPHDANIVLNGRLPKKIDCKNLIGSIISLQGDARLDTIHYPSCGNSLELDLHANGGHKLVVNLDIALKTNTPVIQDTWLDECETISQDTSCKLQSSSCDIPTSTKIINDVPVTRDCWQQSYNYLCRGGNGDGNCKPLQDQGCEQISSVCKTSIDGKCFVYEQNYRCLQKQCSPTSDVVCGNGKDYCIDGNCNTPSYKQSDSFGKAVSSLSAIDNASKTINSNSFSIFEGHASECSEKPMGYSNCCTENGWGQDAGLDHCSDAAKALHVARENKLAVYVGRYCSGPDPIPCIEHAQVYCIFDSKLAKIVQEQGREGQLNIDFGSAKDPVCRGISIEELQAINLSQIDFNDFIQDLNSSVKQPDLKQIQDLIQQHVQQSRQGMSNG